MKNFLDLSTPIRRRFSKAVWVPLRLWEQDKCGRYNQPGFRDAFDGAHSILVPLDKRSLGEEYTWPHDHEAQPWVDKDFYKAADIYSRDPETDVGVRLVLRQSIADQSYSVWHLHPDLIIALGLFREGNFWVRPAEGYAEVVRIRVAATGAPIAIEIRSEFLRDYLCARKAALRIASYHERTVVVENLDGIGFATGIVQSTIDGGRLEQRAVAIDDMGGPFGSKTAVFHVARNDIDIEDDVPIMGPESDNNIDSTSRSFTREGTVRWRVSAEYWRDEWIEPSTTSLRVRHDRVPSTATFVVDGDGTRMSADDLDDEDIGRWLWFAPAVITGLADRRGAILKWYTRDTGGISIASDPAVHFGLNAKGLLTVYARDVARLPEWERRYWAGYNVTPEGGVSEELLEAQVRAKPADTLAPEAFLLSSIRSANAAWKHRYKTDLFRVHAESEEIAARVHCFRALDRHGFFALAKDVARLTADTLDAAVTKVIVASAKSQNWGSLKSLEKALAIICNVDLAHSVMGPLFATYDLRLCDAHLPKSDLRSALDLLGVDESQHLIFQARDMLHAVVSALVEIEMIIKGEHPLQSAVNSVPENLN